MKELLGSEIRVIIDRPIGSHHLEYPDLVYSLNYGYLPGIKSPDGEDVDVYIMGVDHPITEFTGRVIAVIHRKNDIEDKLVVAPEGLFYSREEIITATSFVECYFDICIDLFDEGE